MKEQATQQQVIEYLEIMSGRFNFLYFAPMNETLMMVLIAFRVPKNISFRLWTWFKKMGLVPGVPDIEIIKNGRAYFIEMKTDKGMLNDNQKKFIEKCEVTAVPWSVCRSFDQVVQQLKDWRIIQ